MEKPSSETIPRFDVHTDGVDLLKLFSDLIMQEDSNLWVASGLFSAANGVLLVALFSGTTPLFWTGIITVFGILLSFAWMLAIGWANWREGQWMKKARELQTRLGLPADLAPWGDKAPLAISNRRMLWAVDIAFYLMWAFLLLATLEAAGILKPG